MKEPMSQENIIEIINSSFAQTLTQIDKRLNKLMALFKKQENDSFGSLMIELYKNMLLVENDVNSIKLSFKNFDFLLSAKNKNHYLEIVSFFENSKIFDKSKLEIIYNELSESYDIANEIDLSTDELCESDNFNIVQ